MVLELVPGKKAIVSLAAVQETPERALWGEDILADVTGGLPLRQWGNNA